MRYIIAIGIFQALVTAGLLFKNKLRSTADGLLILLVCCIATHLAIKFVIFNFVQDAQVRFQMNTFIGFCYGPLLYLYALKVQDAGFIPASKWYVFLPFITGAIAYFTVAGVLFFSDHTDYRLLNWYNKISFWILVPSDIWFALLALKHTQAYKAVLHRERRMVERIAYCLLLLSALSMVFYFIVVVLGTGYNILFRSIVYAILAGLSLMIIRYKYVAVNSMAVPIGLPEEAMELSKEEPEIEVSAEKKPESEPSIRRTVLPEEEQREIWKMLEEHLKRSKIFADSDLNLDKLATATGINKYRISETLNSYAHKSFYQYINEYRIQFALEQMQYFYLKSLPVNILSLAYDAGFKAKSSFNRYFKEITGVTPTEYLKSLQKVQGATFGHAAH